MKTVLWILGLSLVAGAFWLYRQGVPRDDEAALLALPVYRVVKDHEPEVYSRVLEQYRASRERRITDAQFTNFANAAISGLATKRIARADPGAQLALMRDMTANLKVLRARNDDTCFQFLYPEIAGSADVASALTPRAQVRTLELAGEVIRTAAESPSAPASPAAAAKKLGPVVDAVYAQFGADTQLMWHVRDPGINRIKVCDIAIALYDRMLAMPPADASLLISAVANPG